MDTFKSVKYLFWVMIGKIVMAIKYASHDRCSVNSFVAVVSPEIEKNCCQVDKPRECNPPPPQVVTGKDTGSSINSIDKAAAPSEVSHCGYNK